MNFSFWPFLWFGLPGRLLKKGSERVPRRGCEEGVFQKVPRTPPQRVRSSLGVCPIKGARLRFLQLGRRRAL